MAEQIEGMDQLLAQLRALEPVIVNATAAAVRESAEAAQSQARRDTPVRSGDLRRGVQIKIRSGGLAADVGVFTLDLYYVLFVHEGTTSIHATPFLTWAAEAERPRLRGRIERHLTQALR